MNKIFLKYLNIFLDNNYPDYYRKLYYNIYKCLTHSKQFVLFTTGPGLTPVLGVLFKYLRFPPKMNNIYPPRFKQTTNIRKCGEDFRQHLGIATEIPTTDDDIKEAMQHDGTDDDFERLLASVSLEKHLQHIDDIRPTKFEPSSHQSLVKSKLGIPKDALRLNTVATLVDYQEKLDHKQRTLYYKFNKYKSLKCTSEPLPAADIAAHSEQLIIVRVYEPFRFIASQYIQKKPKLSQRFRVLGSQYLHELRDRILCQCKYGPFYDISEVGPSEIVSPPAEQTPFDHGFFFIDNTFYNDTRQPTIDYSETIREWAKKQASIEPLHVDCMETTTFNDLTIRLGAPYLYQHHGNCEHLFTFSDVRLIGAEDILCRSEYPIMDMMSLTRTTFCMICGKNEAVVIVTNSREHIYDPSFLCARCFESFHYVDGRKVGEFQAYRFCPNKFEK